MNKGYIAITASVFLALLITVIAVSLGGASFLGRIGSLDFQAKKESFFAVRTCLDKALLELALDSNYAGNETVQILEGGNQCALFAIESSPPNKIIKARSQVRGATTNLKLTVNSTSLSTVSLEEVSVF